MPPKKLVKPAADSNSTTQTSAAPHPDLPKETWLQIISHFSLKKHDLSLHDPGMADNWRAPSPAPYLNDKWTLRSLSQVSRSFRELALPLLWDQVEMTLAVGSGVFYKQLAEKGERVSKGLVNRSPQLLPLVHTVYMSLTRVTPAITMPPINKLLSSLPNLETIIIPHAHSAITSFIADHFHSPLPTLKKFAGPSSMHNLLKLAPNIEEVECNYGDGGKFIGSMIACQARFKLKSDQAKKCRRLEGFNLDEKESVGLCKRIVKCCPELEVLVVFKEPHQDCVKVLQSLKKLKTIVVRLVVPPRQVT